MKTNIHIFTQKSPTSANVETDLWIDWEGVSEQDLRTIAQFYITSRVQRGFKAGQEAIPALISVRASDFVHPTQYADFSEQSKKQKEQQKERMSEFEKIIDALPTAERAAILVKLQSISNNKGK